MAIGDIGSNVKHSKVTILNLKGLKLVGELDDVGSKDLCILCHGFRSSKRDPTLISASKALTGVGISTYRFDFTGNGESDGEFSYGSYWREAEDIRSVVNYWRFRHWRILSLIGHSKGGNAVVLYESKYGDTGSIVNLCGRFDLTRGELLLVTGVSIGDGMRLCDPTFLSSVKSPSDFRVSAVIDFCAFPQGYEARFRGKKGVQKLKDEGFLDILDRSGKFEFRVSMSDMEERFATDMHKACLEIPEHCRVLNVHGSADATVPAEDANEFGRRIRNSNVHIIDGADHNFKLQQDEIAKLIVDFVRASPKHPQLRALL